MYIIFETKTVLLHTVVNTLLQCVRHCINVIQMFCAYWLDFKHSYKTLIYYKSFYILKVRILKITCDSTKLTIFM